MSDDSAGRNEDQYRETRLWQDLDTMLSVDDARERILSSIRECEPEPVTIADCHGLVLAQDVIADAPVPPFRNSAMDGYAVRARDVESATFNDPVKLTVIGNLPAGQEPARAVGEREAIRIMTGAVMPDGADSVVRFEETSDPGHPEYAGEAPVTSVLVYRAPSRGANVREAGEDLAAGELVLRAGRKIKAAIQGILASVNLSQVQVIPRPVVGILATGDEIVDPGGPIRPGQIRNSNNFTIAGLVREAGGIPEIIGIAGDTAASIRKHLADVSRYDLLITSGGVSLGDYDVVKDVLQSEGSIDLWQVRIKPGKPMAFGRIGDVPLIGLPGNPVAAYVAFQQFAAPSIQKMRGAEHAPARPMRARLLCEHENRGQRRHFVRGVYRERNGELVVEPVPTQGSGVLSAVARSNCFFVIPESVTHASAGMLVDVLPIDN